MNVSEALEYMRKGGKVTYKGEADSGTYFHIEDGRLKHTTYTSTPSLPPINLHRFSNRDFEVYTHPSAT